MEHDRSREGQGEQRRDAESDEADGLEEETGTQRCAADVSLTIVSTRPCTAVRTSAGVPRASIVLPADGTEVVLGSDRGAGLHIFADPVEGFQPTTWSP